MLGELNSNEIEQLLDNNSVGHIGCTDGTTVYIVPINYQFHSGFVLCYSIEGLKIDMMRKNPSVCFQVDEIKSANEWKSVVIYGTYEEITDENELRKLRPHYTEYMLRKRVSLTAVPADSDTEIQRIMPVKAQVFYRIRFKRLTGRFEDGFVSSGDLSFDVPSKL